MTLQTLIRVARPDDLVAVDALLGRSYPRLLKADYAPSIMVTIVPVLSRARPELLASGRYFLAEDMDGRVVGAGGYSLAAGTARGAADGGGVLAHVRHLATDPDATRQGIARHLMQAIVTAARAEGVGRFDCLATLTAVPFYAAVGFRTIGPVDVPILPGLSFPAIRMWRAA